MCDTSKAPQASATTSTTTNMEDNRIYQAEEQIFDYYGDKDNKKMQIIATRYTEAAGLGRYRKFPFPGRLDVYKIVNTPSLINVVGADGGDGALRMKNVANFGALKIMLHAALGRSGMHGNIAEMALFAARGSNYIEMKYNDDDNVMFIRVRQPLPVP